MKAKHILLNHFSQRYPKIPVWNLFEGVTDGSAKTDSQPIISISFDLMTARISDLWKMRHYMDAISVLFAETELEEGDDTTAAVEHDINNGAEDMADAEMEEVSTNGGSAPVPTQKIAAQKGGKKGGAGRHKAHVPKAARVMGKKRSSTPPSGTHVKKSKGGSSTTHEAAPNGAERPRSTEDVTEVEMTDSPKLEIPTSSGIDMK